MTVKKSEQTTATFPDDTDYNNGKSECETHFSNTFLKLCVLFSDE